MTTLSQGDGRDYGCAFSQTAELFEGSEAEAAELVAAYLVAQQERAAEQVRAAEPAPAGG